MLYELQYIAAALLLLREVMSSDKGSVAGATDLVSTEGQVPSFLPHTHAESAVLAKRTSN